MTADPRYVIARRVLLDALQVLDDQLDAIVLVGAQAVYLRTGEADISVAPYTTDGDLAVDSDKLRPSPLLDDLMSRLFEPKSGAGDAREPGIWIQTVRINGENFEVPIDLIVPEGIAPPGGTRGARLGPHGNRAARKAAGLEAAVVDNDVLPIPALEPEDGRIVKCRVAGSTALLIAKAHKIQDRLDKSDKPERIVDKDAADVYRLMQATPPDLVVATAANLLTDRRVAEPSRHGLELLRQQFGARRAPGIEMAVRSLRLGVPEDRIRAFCVAYVAALEKS